MTNGADKPFRLAAVNFFLGCVGITQVTRILLWQRSQTGSTKETLKEDTAGIKDAAVGAVKEVESKVKAAT